eukprot:GHVS01102676.1.p1 GENE.GHVS01102676.1~~GHVS01102676.1.p1  ORF type:complete len:275 (+),score=44.70 GHVS01102676.1:75-899(+)
MYSLLLTMLLFFTVVCLSSAHTSPAEVHRMAGNSTDSYPPQTPDGFMGNVKYVLPGYPPLAKFFFEVPARPQNEKLYHYINECMAELSPLSTDLAHTVQAHFQCDIAPFWTQYYQTFAGGAEEGGTPREEVRRRLVSGAAVQEKVGSAVEDGRRADNLESNLIWMPCQLAEVAESCMLGDALVSCVRNRVVDDVRGIANNQFSNKGSGAAAHKFLSHRNVEIVNKATMLFTESREWTANFCQHMTGCRRRVEEVPQLGDEIVRRMGGAKYAGCF